MSTSRSAANATHTAAAAGAARWATTKRGRWRIRSYRWRRWTGHGWWWVIITLVIAGAGKYFPEWSTQAAIGIGSIIPAIGRCRLNKWATAAYPVPVVIAVVAVRVHKIVVAHCIVYNRVGFAAANDNIGAIWIVITVPGVIAVPVSTYSNSIRTIKRVGVVKGRIWAVIAVISWWILPVVHIIIVVDRTPAVWVIYPHTQVIILRIIIVISSVVRVVRIIYCCIRIFLGRSRWVIYIIGCLSGTIHRTGG